MKLYIMIFILLIMCGIAQAIDNDLLEKIPENYWIYDVLNKFVEIGVLDNPDIYKPGNLITKYRVGVSIVYIVDNIEKKNVSVNETILSDIEDLTAEFSEVIESIFDFDAGELILKINRLAGKNIDVFADEKVEEIPIERDKQSFYWENTICTVYRNQFYDDSQESRLNNSLVSFYEIIYHNRALPWIFLDIGSNINYSVDQNDQNYFLHLTYFNFQQSFSFSGNIQNFQNREDMNESIFLPSFNFKYIKNYNYDSKLVCTISSKSQKFSENDLFRNDFNEKKIELSVDEKLEIFDIFFKYVFKVKDTIHKNELNYSSNRLFLKFEKKDVHGFDIIFSTDIDNRNYKNSPDLIKQDHHLKIGKKFYDSIDLYYVYDHQINDFGKNIEINRNYTDKKNVYGIIYDIFKHQQIAFELIQQNRTYSFSDTPVFNDSNNKWYRFIHTISLDRLSSEIDVKLRRNFIDLNMPETDDGNSFDNDISVNVNYVLSPKSSFYINADYILRRYDLENNISFMQDISTGVIYRF